MPKRSIDDASGPPPSTESLRGAVPAVIAEFVDHDIYERHGLSLDAAFSLSDADIKHVNTVGGGQKAVNYGEVLLSSWSRVLDAVALGPDDVFVDLGSGRGQLVMYTHLVAGLRRSVGVELSRERHAMATRALAELGAADARGGTSLAAGLTFLNEDIRTTSLRGATFVFLMNQDMPHKLIAKAWENILAAGGPMLVATLHAPRDVNLALHGVVHVRTLHDVPQTWNGATDVHLFRVPAVADASTIVTAGVDGVPPSEE